MTTTTTVPPGWYPDPALRHQYRFWDGETWTDRASDIGRVVVDPPSTDAPTVEVPTVEATAGETETRPEVHIPAPRYGGPGLPVPPSRRRAGGRGLLFGALAVGAALVLLAGLLIWSPWSGGGPARPTGVSSDFPTATSVSVGWSAPPTDAGVDRFVIQRDGRDVGSVSGTATSYVDKGLTSASKHHYVVFAVAGGDRSVGSKTLTVRMPSPLPTDVRLSGVTPTSATVTWSAPAEGTPPESYVVFRGDQLVGTVSANKTSYVDKGLAPAGRYSYSVAAVWGDESAMLYSTEPISVRTGTPTLASARLSGTWTVVTSIVRSGGGSVSVGDRFTDTWRFRPTCRDGACDVRVIGAIGGSSYTAHTFRMDLERGAGGVYTGSTTAHLTHCGAFPNQIDVRNTVQVRVTIRKGRLQDGTWSASRWQGTMTVTSPYVQATPTTYCPAQSFTGNLRAQR